MLIVPCPLCGYHAPADACPHCGGTSTNPSLAKRRSGPLTGIVDGALALPKGVVLVLRTRGIKRWLVPPLMLTCGILTFVLWWLVGYVNGLLDQALPDEIVLDPSWAWLDSLSDGWGWLQSAWAGIVVAAQWTANASLSMLTSVRPLAWFLLGSLAVWYCFSIAYEAFAGPFLDEVQGRVESKWFGTDPRSNLERPNDIPVSRCIALTVIAAALAVVVGVVAWPYLSFASILVAVPLGIAPAVAFDRRYGAWLRWVADVEGRAVIASFKATLLTGLIIVLGLPLYFVPVVGYFLFAAVTGCATAIGLLDIPAERRGWSFRQRVRFVGRNLLPILVFGVEAGFLLAVPIVGPVLMVPAASLGGLWLVCRLDKGFLR